MPPRQAQKARARPKASHSRPRVGTDRSLASMNLLDLFRDQLIASFWPNAFDGLDLSQDDRALIQVLLPEELTALGPRHDPRRFRGFGPLLGRLPGHVSPDKIINVLMDDRVSVQRFVVRFLRYMALPSLGRHLSSLKAYARWGDRLFISEEASQAIQRDIDRIARSRDAAQRYVAQAGRYVSPRRVAEITPQAVALVRLFTGVRLSKNQAFRDTAALLNAWHGSHTLTAEQVRLRYQHAT